MDLQGFDPIAYKGMIDTLKKNEDLIVQMEYWPWGIVKAGENPKKWLESIENLLYLIDFEDESIKDIHEPYKRERYTSIWLRKISE
jgi:hypothetical protein